MKNVAMILLLFVVIAAMMPATGLALTINYAHLNQGASIYDFSSALDDYQGLADARDVIGGRDVVPLGYSWYLSGERGNFIFDIADTDQFIIVDLGANRLIDRVGSSFVLYPSDREVWDYFGVSIGTDAASLSLVGHVGTKGDNIVDVSTSPIYYDLSAPTLVRYIKYEFGSYSFDWGGGSRVYSVYAEATTVPEPATGLLFAAGAVCLAAVGLRRKR